MPRRTARSAATTIDNAARDALAALIENYSYEQAVSWLQRKFSSFAPGLTIAAPAFSNRNEKDYFDSAQILGFVKTLPDKTGENRPLVVASVLMNRPLAERTSRLVQFDYAKKIVQVALDNPPAGIDGLCTQGLFFFYDADGNFRISFVTARVDRRTKKWSDARRHSFFCRADRRCNTMRKRLGDPVPSFEALEKAFSVEQLTKDFYEHLFKWYEWACAPETGVSFPNRIGDETDDRTKIQEAVIRLITRLLFVWFVRERGLVPDEPFARSWAETNLRDFKPESLDGKNGTSYYRAVLQNLFFATLNVPPDERTWAQTPYHGHASDHDVRNRYRFREAFRDPDVFFSKDSSRKSLLRDIPFLNCALFDCLDPKAESGNPDDDVYLDGFSRNEKCQAVLPNALFFGDGSDEEGHEGLLNLLAAYDFTIDENATNDGDVALDPELLGKVFENLLGAFNHETQEAARKMTGSFYTPREIVDYMVEQSLRAHLRAKVPAAADEKKLDELFRRAAAGEDNKKLPFSPDEQNALLEALYDCRSLDPACGSGAFPMGMLHAMTRLLAVLDPSGLAILTRIQRRYKEDQFRLSAETIDDPAEKQKRFADLDKMFSEQKVNLDYARKLWIIENCIYGVDIQPIAAQISKLRFYISLLCDQPDPPDGTPLSEAFVALPNLESKFVCANTLLPLPDVGGEFDFSGGKIPKLRTDLREIRHAIFQARGWKTKRKYQEKEKAKRAEIAAAVSDSLCTPDGDRIRRATELLGRLEGEWESVREPRWEERRKPVQDALFGDPPAQEVSLERFDANEEKRRRLETCMANCRREIDRENAKKNRAAGNSNVERLSAMVAAWDPYDQNASAGFFDPDWMFDVRDGFDIVIGNPPYFVIKKNNDLKGTYETLYPDYKSGRVNIYQLFFAVSTRLTSKTGMLSYIHPKTLLGDAYLAATRKQIVPAYDSCKIVNIENRTDTFEGVLQSVVVSFWYREGNGTAETGIVRTKSDLDHLQFYSCPKQNIIMPDGRILASDNETDYIVARRIMSECKNPLGFVTGSIEWNKYKRWLSSSPTNNSARMLFGENVQRYFLAPPARRADSAFINSNEAPRFDGIALVTQRTTAVEQPWRIIATLIDSHQEKFPIVTENSTNVFKVDTKNQGLYLLGCINSHFMDYWFRLFNSNTHVSSGELNSLPFPPAPPASEMRKIESLVDRILATKKENPSADTAALEKDIDQIVYKLYGLTQPEIDIVEGRDAETDSRNAEGVSRPGSNGKTSKAKGSHSPAPDEDDYLE